MRNFIPQYICTLYTYKYAARYTAVYIKFGGPNLKFGWVLAPSAPIALTPCSATPVFGRIG